MRPVMTILKSWKGSEGVKEQLEALGHRVSSMSGVYVVVVDE